jgi:tetratricopeptide (TPR) repeat protein
MKIILIILIALIFTGNISAQLTKEQEEIYKNLSAEEKKKMGAKINEELKLMGQKSLALAHDKQRETILKTKPLGYDSVITIVKKVNKTKEITLLEYLVHNNFGGNENEALENYAISDTFYLKAKKIGPFDNIDQASVMEGYYYVKNNYDYARSLFRRKRFQEALINFETTADYYQPDSSYLYAARAGIKLIETGKEINKINVLNNFNKAISLDPKNPIAIGERGIFYVSILKDTTRATADFSKAVQLNPKDAESYEYLSLINYYAGNNAAAISAITKCIEIYKMQPSYYGTRAHYYNHIKSYELAIKDYNEAIFLDPTNNESYYLKRGACQKAINNYIAAYDDYGFATMINPSNTDAKKELQKLDPYLKEAYEKIGYTQQNGFQFFLNRAEQLAKLSAGLNLGPAVMNYYKCIQIEPKNPVPYFKAGKIFKYLKMTGYAEQFLRYAAYADGKNSEYFSALGDVYLDQSNYKNASGCFDTAALLGSRDIILYIANGNLKYTKLNNKIGALKDFNIALTIDPLNIEALTNRGFYYFEIADYNAALADFLAVKKIDPTNEKNIQYIEACKDKIKK